MLSTVGYQAWYIFYMKQAKNFFWAALASTFVYEALVSAPWWSGLRSDRYDMLINLAVPSLILMVFAYYLLQKKQLNHVGMLSAFIVVLQISILLTIYGALRGLLP